MSDQVGREARVGARWWADQIREGFFPDAGGEPGDAIEHPMAKGLVSLLQEKEMAQLTPEKVDAYEAALARRIQAMLDGDASHYSTAMDLGCDYGPGPAHRKAFEEAGIKPGMTLLPWKTTMWVEPGCVSVGAGYGAEPVDLPLEDDAEAR